MLISHVASASVGRLSYL